MNILDEVNKLQAKIERAKEQRIRAEAARDEAFRRLQDMGFDSLADALDAINMMSDEVDKLNAKLSDELAIIEKTYPQLME